MKTNKNTSQKGITLIALVITIIIMLILAGVTIGLVFNGGLIDYAKKASDKTEQAMSDEELGMSQAIDTMEEVSGNQNLKSLRIAISSQDKYCSVLEGISKNPTFCVDENGEGTQVNHDLSTATTGYLCDQNLNNVAICYTDEVVAAKRRSRMGSAVFGH